MTAKLAAFLEECTSIATPEALGLLELRRDPLYRHIPASERMRLVAAALARGDKASKDLSGDPMDIAGWLNVKVDQIEGDDDSDRKPVFADYRSKPPRVRLFLQAIAVLDAALEAYPDFEALNETGTSTVFLVRELYRHIEAQRPSRALVNRYKIKTFGFGPFRVTKGLTSLAEIAAGALAQKLLGLKYHPKLLDLMAAYMRDPAAAQKMAERLREAHAEAL